MEVGDGGLGFWAAMAEEYPETREQRCWVHKTVNVLDKLPKTLQPNAKDKDVLFTFYAFPAAHWPHLRTSNPIESTFATVRLRTERTKGCGIARNADFTQYPVHSQPTRSPPRGQ